MCWGVLTWLNILSMTARVNNTCGVCGHHLSLSVALCGWRAGLDRDTWKFKPESSEPKIEEGMMVHGRNAKRLAELLAMVEAQKGKLTAAEVVAMRLYTGTRSS